MKNDKDQVNSDEALEASLKRLDEVFAVLDQYPCSLPQISAAQLVKESQERLLDWAQKQLRRHTAHLFAPEVLDSPAEVAVPSPQACQAFPLESLADFSNVNLVFPCYSPAMPENLTSGQKAALTRKRRAAALKAKQTRKRMSAFTKARAAEAASKEALRAYCAENGWKLAFFEGETGAPRTGIIDAIVYRLGKGNADQLDIRLIQLKGGSAGVTPKEIARLKEAVKGVAVEWAIAAFDGDVLHIVPDTLNGQ